MKMKKIAIIAASLLLVASLGSCRGRGRGDSSATGSESVPSGITGTSTGGSSATSGKSSSSGKTSSSKTSSSKTSSTPSSYRTAEEVIQEIVELTFEEPAVEDDNYFYDSENEMYYTGVSFGTEYADDAYLLAAISALADDGCLPSYLEIYEEPSVKSDESGNYGDGLWISDDLAVGVELMSYVYDTVQYGLCCDIYVFDLA